MIPFLCYNGFGDIMIYLDYSATTPVDSRVLDTYVKVSKDYIGNVNSLHKLGVEAKKLQDRATEQIANLLHVKASEIIYTSGASESNNTAIKGIAFRYQNRGKHIITTPLEHSSILEPLHYLETLGFEIDYVHLKKDGTVDLEDLKNKMRDDTILVSIASVSSELGILQPIDQIGTIVKQYPKCFFHSDMTQSMGKVEVSLQNVDLVSFSAHKFYGVKGIGCLVKKDSIDLLPLIHGGKSTTRYRSGTPALPLIVSTSRALRLAYDHLDQKWNHVATLNRMITDRLAHYEKVFINSTEKSLPHILNISIVGIKPETFLHALESHEIYISTQSACSTPDHPSLPVMSVTNDPLRATTSLRISLSHLTKEEEIHEFLKVFDECIQMLKIRS